MNTETPGSEPDTNLSDVRPLSIYRIAAAISSNRKTCDDRPQAGQRDGAVHFFNISREPT